MNLEYRGNSVLLHGQYDEETDVIWISYGLSPLEAECVFYHERQHRRCYLAKCSCWGRKTDYLTEYHAFKGELEAIILRGSKLLSRVYLRSIADTWKKINREPKRWKDHIKALRRVMRSKKFKKLVREMRK